MNDDSRQPGGPPQYPSVGVDTAPALPAVPGVLPVGAFTASVLMDVLSLVADSPEHARSYTRGAVELLRVGLGASLAALAIGLLDALKIPAATPAGKAATKQVALDGAVVAVYLLDLAARQKQLADAQSEPGKTDVAPIGLSLAGLALLGAAGKLKVALPGNVKKT